LSRVRAPVPEGDRPSRHCGSGRRHVAARPSRRSRASTCSSLPTTDCCRSSRSHASCRSQFLQRRADVHGRDVFARQMQRWRADVAWRTWVHPLATPPTPHSHPIMMGQQWMARSFTSDRFGRSSRTFPVPDVDAGRGASRRGNGRRGAASTFGDVERGTLVAFVGSGGRSRSRCGTGALRDCWASGWEPRCGQNTKAGNCGKRRRGCAPARALLRLSPL